MVEGLWTCCNYKKDQPTIEVQINNNLVRSKKEINVLGVMFDSKLQWTTQMAQAINKSKRALHAIKLDAKYLTKPNSTGLAEPKPKFFQTKIKSLFLTN